MKLPLSLIFLILLGISGCQSAPKTAEPTDTERAPSSANFPNWTLLDLGKDQKIGGTPDWRCLQKYMEQFHLPNQDWPEPFLAKNVIDLSEAMKIDPYIFAGLIQQETGDFVSKRGRNGVGLTQMTNIAVRDACLALEGSGCEKAQSNPKYLETWKSLFTAGVNALYGNYEVKYYYPWRSQCIFYEHRCEADCGIDNACMLKIRDNIFDSPRTDLLMGAFTLINKLGEAKANKPSLKGMDLYRAALKLYNGHESYKVKYANAIIDRHVPAILRACPPVDSTENN